MPPKMGLRVRSCFHNAFSAVDCQEISGRFWPVADHLEWALGSLVMDAQMSITPSLEI